MKMEQTSVETRIRQLTALAGFITSVLAKLSFETVQYWLKNKTLLRQKLQEVFEIPVETYAGARAEWQKFYLDHFGLSVNFSEVQIPERLSSGSWRLLFIPASLTMNKTFAVMQSLFKAWRVTEDLDEVVPTNTRTSTKSYAIWVRDGVEPDEKYLGKSTREADMKGIIGMTLLERLVLEVKYFVETDKNLDYKGVTFCTGSRLSDGAVPIVYFFSGYGKVEVCWYDLDGSGSAFGLRQAVSL